MNVLRLFKRESNSVSAARVDKDYIAFNVTTDEEVEYATEVLTSNISSTIYMTTGMMVVELD